MVSVKSLMETIPHGIQTATEVSSVGVSLCKEDHGTLTLGDKLKLSKSAREGKTDKFNFFQADRAVGSESRTVYNFHMRIDAL